MTVIVPRNHCPHTLAYLLLLPKSSYKSCAKSCPPTTRTQWFCGMVLTIYVHYNPGEWPPCKYDHVNEVVPWRDLTVYRRKHAGWKRAAYEPSASIYHHHTCHDYIPIAKYTCHDVPECVFVVLCLVITNDQTSTGKNWTGHRPPHGDVSWYIKQMCHRLRRCHGHNSNA